MPGRYLQTRVKEQKKLLQDGVSFDQPVYTNFSVKKKKQKNQVHYWLLPGW
jgi:hypothetical protein